MCPSKDQKFELSRAIFRNAHLKEKEKYLENECKMLAQLIHNSQVTTEETKATQFLIEQDLQKLRQDYKEKIEELQCKERSSMTLSLSLEDTKSSIHDSLHSEKSLKEILDFKGEMIDCLQQELIQVRLNEAEKGALIRDLKRTQQDYETEHQILVRNKPETIAKLQEELLAAKLLERPFGSDFDKIKVKLSELKADYQNYQNEHQEGRVHLAKNSVRWVNTVKGENEVEDRIQELENERTNLQELVPDLEANVVKVTEQIVGKEAHKAKLKEELTNKITKLKSDESLIDERKRQYKNLENITRDKVTAIHKNIKDKDEEIDRLKEKLEELTGKPIVIRDDVEAELIQRLEENAGKLEEQIVCLTQELSELQNKN